MTIDVFLTPTPVTDKDVKGRTVVVVDVLRASSTIVTALHNGARSVVPVPDMETARRLAGHMDQGQSLLCGEHNGIKIDGCALGNSPFEYTPATVKQRTILLKTTNGTGAVLRGKPATHLLIGSFLNAASVVEFVQQKGLDLTFICSGWRGRSSFEDTVCVGLLLHRLWNGERPESASDGARIALALYRDYQHELPDAVASSEHGRRLAALGHAEDLAYACKTDELSMLPYLSNSVLRPYTARARG